MTGSEFVVLLLPAAGVVGDDGRFRFPSSLNGTSANNLVWWNCTEVLSLRRLLPRKAAAVTGSGGAGEKAATVEGKDSRLEKGLKRALVPPALSSQGVYRSGSEEKKLKAIKP